MRAILLLVVFALPLCSGCTKGSAKKDSAERIAPGIAMAPKTPGLREEFEAGGKEAAPQAPPAGQKKQPKADAPRKIKYTAEMHVIVDDFDKAWEGLKTVMKDTKAIRAQEDINSSPGSQRMGTWRLRVPVEQLDSFRSAVVKLGDVEKNTLQSQDITAEYYDLEAHIKNKQTEREAIRKILEKTGDRDLQQFFTVKRELDSITDWINREEGKLRLMANLADLTTVTVQLRERHKTGDRRPDDRPVPQDFGTRATDTWTSSWDSFVGFVQWIAVAAIFVTPWLPVPIVLGLLLWMFVKFVAWMTRAKPS